MTAPLPGASAPTTAPPARLPRWTLPLLGVVLFSAALWVLYHELRAVSYRQVAGALQALPPARVLLAVLLTAAQYLVLTGYDHLAFRYVGKQAPRVGVTLASFVGYAISNNVGPALLPGPSVRYRFFSRWGLAETELARVVVFYSGTLWVGLLALGGWSLAFQPHPALAMVPGGGLPVRSLGVLLLVSALGYVALSLTRRAPLQLGPRTLTLPPPRLALGQLLLSSLDWALAAAVLHVLLQADAALSFGSFLGAFLAAQLLGLVSQVPGGLGVFEGVMVLTLKAYLPAEHLLAALVLYRVVYYLLPLTAAMLILVADEMRLRRDRLARLGSVAGSLTVQLAPKLLAVFAFLAGALLLLSGATPAEAGRLHWLARALPLAVFEASHFLGSIVGVGLLLASAGVARRLDAAYWLAMLGLGMGIATSLLKGGDYEEALLLALLLLLFAAGRREFDRRAALFAAPFSVGWLIASAAVVGASIWLGLFAFKHVEYSDQLWWRFALDADASRFLRASVGATVGLLVFGAVRLLRPAPPEVPLPSNDQLDRAGRIIQTQSSTLPFLAFLRDKALIFNDAEDAFLMYGVQGRTWVALGDPVGPAESAPELIRRFLERVDDFGGAPVFYQVAKDRLHQYADFGLTFAKLGEEARVPIQGFTLEGKEKRSFRTVINRMERDGGRFRLLAAGEVPAAMPQLQSVSEDWLAHKGAAEKGFSLGFFDPAYVARFPVGVLEVEGRIEAFASLWASADRFELSVDLMRFRRSAPPNAMEALFIHLMLWGGQQGYHWFSLGMAPLSGLELSPFASAWSRLGHFVFRYGDAFYNFQGLRAYKQKFHPEWEPRYMAYPGGLSLPRVLADISALVAGGYRRIFR